jgi:hypothetical protein
MGKLATALGIATACVVALAAGPHQPVLAQQAPAVALDDNDIGGVVTGPDGPEAGVWVIAETDDFDTRFARIVVTDDRGRYVVPDLPKADYSLWVRGYGLVDSPKVRSEPGRTIDLRAVRAPDAAKAAQYYPAIYWYSMLKIPEKDEFNGEGDIPKGVTLPRWLNAMKSNGCVGCHQMGSLATRTIPKALGEFDSSVEAWTRRVQSGQAGENMVNPLAGALGGVPFRYFADWTDRVAKGALPHTRPERPQGVERNIVVTVWDWLDEKHYLHDLISTDRRFPTVNGYGPVYGAAEYSTDAVPILDPIKNAASSFVAPVRDANTPPGTVRSFAASEKPLAPSPYWGEEVIWDSKANMHNPMFDRQGRVWFTAAIRARDNPEFCKKGSSHPSARAFPLNAASRHLSVYDPKTQKYTFVDTCYSTHHLQFAADANDTLWTSGGGPVLGWLNTKLFDETGDAARAQGWTPLILDSNGNGKRDEYTEPDQPADPAKDMRIVAPFYAVMPSPADGSVWGSQAFQLPGRIMRVVPGANPSETALTEVFNVPPPGFGPRGADIDKQGVVWVSLASGHLASFDRRKCKGPMNGPAAKGDHCPEGWAFHKFPGPGFEGIGDNSAESSYYAWVDQHNTFGLGEDVPMATGNLNDGLIALKDGRMIVLRVPYPMGFYAKGFDGRIDDPNAGWKGRGLWSTSGDRTPWFIEGGKGSKPLVVQFQLRPDPLAK